MQTTVIDGPCLPGIANTVGLTELGQVQQHAYRDREPGCAEAACGLGGVDRGERKSWHAAHMQTLHHRNMEHIEGDNMGFVAA